MGEKIPPPRLPRAVRTVWFLAAVTVTASDKSRWRDSIHLDLVALIRVTPAAEAANRQLRQIFSTL